MSTIFHTTMHEAFVAAKVKKSTSAAIINTCAKALSRPRAGAIHMGKGWNASLSFKTAQKLGMPVCDNPYVSMAYDNMVKGV